MTTKRLRQNSLSGNLQSSCRPLNNNSSPIIVDRLSRTFFSVNLNKLNDVCKSSEAQEVVGEYVGHALERNFCNVNRWLNDFIGIRFDTYRYSNAYSGSF